MSSVTVGSPERPHVVDVEAPVVRAQLLTLTVAEATDVEPPRDSQDGYAEQPSRPDRNGSSMVTPGTCITAVHAYVTEMVGDGAYPGLNGYQRRAGGRGGPVKTVVARWVLVAGVGCGFRGTRRAEELLTHGPAGHFKGRNPTVSMATLAVTWVADAHVMNIGMATPLRQRLDSYRRYGEGQPDGHQGGRYIRQLADAADLLVAWKATEEDPADAEARLIFMDEHGGLAFRQPQRRASAVGHTDAGHPKADRREGRPC